MRIRTRVTIGGALTICVLLAYGALVLHLDRTMGNLAQEVREANKIVNNITILRSLTQDYLLYHTERSQRQWAAVYAEMLQMLQNPEYRVLISEHGIGDPLNKLKIVGDTFSRLMTTRQPAGPNNPGEGAQGELQSRLTTQLLLATQDLLTRFLNLTGTINGKLIATQRLTSVLDILALAALGILLISNMVFLQRSVVKPILKLHDGAEIIGAGNLGYKVGLATPDEIGQLSQAFDRMTANLQEITVSRDELAQEIEERKRVEAELRESQQQAVLLADLMESSSQPFGTGFIDGRLGMCNAAFPRLLGYSKEEFLALNWGKGITPPEWLEKEAASLEELHRTGQPVRYAKEYWRKDGTRVPVELLVHLRRDEQGEPSYYYAFVTDITERQKAEEAIKHLASFPEMNPAPVLEIDLSGAVTYYNPATLKVLEKLGPEAGWGDILPGDLKEITAAAREKKGRGFYREVRIKDTTFSQNIYFAEPLNVLRVYSADITERRQAEEALKDSEERFRTLVNAMPQLAWIANSDGYIFWYNQRWYDYTGTTPEEMEGWGWQSVHDPEVLPKVLEQWRASIATGKPFDMVFPLRAGDGQFRQFLTRVLPMKDVRGQVIQWFGTNTDITERQQTQEKLQRTLENLERSNQELEQFAYISSHDLQEPLRKIANFSEMLAQQYRDQLDERAVRYFGYVTDGAKRMQALINALLNYSRLGRAEFPLIPTSLEDILKGTMNDLHALIKESHAEISRGSLPTLKVNPHQMGQLLQNLITNAIKFHGDQPPGIHFSARQEGREWLVCVRDNGIGFDPQYAESIFKVFKRLHTQEAYPGTGIGLAICQKIVERHGGRIWAESEPGRGTTFYFTIPG